MALANLRDLLGPDEHALDLGGLVGAAHPALDAHVGAPARARARQRRGEIAKREPDPGMTRIAPTSPSATGSPVPGLTISRIKSSLTTMPTRAGVSNATMPRSAVPNA